DCPGAAQRTFDTRYGRADFQQRLTGIRRVFEEGQTLGDGKQAHECDDKIKAAEQIVGTEGETWYAADRIDADCTQQQADAGGNEALDQAATGDTTDGGERQRIQGEVFGRAEANGKLHQQRRQQGEADGGDGAAD